MEYKKTRSSGFFLTKKFDPFSLEKFFFFIEKWIEYGIFDLSNLD